MNLPISPPTDSLYKFLSIAGLTVAVVTYIFVTLEVRHVVDSAFEHQAAVSILALDTAALESDVEAIRGKASPTEKRALEGRRRALDQRLAALDASARSKSDRANETLRLVRWRTFVTLTGVAISVGGFIAWYFRIQIYQDQILREAARAAADAASVNRQSQ